MSCRAKLQSPPPDARHDPTLPCVTVLAEPVSIPLLRVVLNISANIMNQGFNSVRQPVLCDSHRIQLFLAQVRVPAFLMRFPGDMTWRDNW
jgi:hypothetical protein